MAKIKGISALEILDSKGNPTVQTTITLDNGITATASSPNGTSIGSYEAVALKDKDEKRFSGLGVLKAIDNIQNIIAPQIIGKDSTSQHEIDNLMIELDGTQKKEKLGSNAILSVSMALAKTGALDSNTPLFIYLQKLINKNGAKVKIPTPAFNLINGALHAENKLDFQEFLLIPGSFKTYKEALEIGSSIYAELRKNLKNHNFSTSLGDEGGYSANIPNNHDALNILKQTIDATSFKYSFDVFLGLDIAANSIFQNNNYLVKDKPTPLSSNEFLGFINEINNQFNLLYIEDPFQEDDWENWQKITSTSNRTIIVGDDLIATNPFRLQIALNKNAVTGVIIKPNQIGTVIEALAVAEIARAGGLKIIVSHRSGETNDDFIADFAVALGADYVKFGAPGRGERVAKYNRLLEIEQILSNQKQSS